MNLYLIEVIVFLIMILIITLIFKAKNIHKLGLVLSVFLLIFVGSISATYVLEKPKLDIKGQEMNLEVNQYGKVEIPHTTYHMKDVTSSVDVKGNIDYTKPGTYKIQYEVPTITGKYSLDQTVNIVDTTPPTITLKGDKECNLSYSAEYKEAGYTVEDNSSENLTEKVKVEKEEISDTEYDIVYSVEDSAGNKATERRKVHIIDDVSPTIKLKGSANMKVLLNNKYKENGATAVDAKDGDLSDKIKISGTVNTAKVGEYTIKYSVSDKAGNKAEKTRKVTVYKKENIEVKQPVDTKTQTQTQTQPSTQPVTQTTTQSQNQNNKSGNKGVIYLTFDDGPSSNITPKILNILKKKNVKATFFILNYGSSLEYLIKREYNEGHSIGIHGYSHTYSKIYTSEEAFMNNITKLQKKIKNTIGYSPTIIRFPGGSSNTVSRNYSKGIMTRLTKKVVANGFKYYDWNVSSGDAGGARTSKQVYNNVTKGLKKNRSNVVLMHDFGGNTKTLNALSDIIDYGLKNGYTFKPITMSTPMVTHSVNN